MNEDIRNALRTAVVACRSELQRDVRIQLESVYGVTPNGEFLANEQLVPYDGDAGRWRRERESILSAITHIQRGDVERVAAVEQFVRETAFTILNRLAALKLMEHESRGLTLQSIAKSKDSKGFSLFTKVAPGVCRAARNSGVLDGGYRLYLECLFDDLAEELGILFDRQLPQAIVFPSDGTLMRVLALLNAADITSVWGADETIGWIYQYFTPKELRDNARRESSAPRNSNELSFRNQFYTPRYVVEFLVDNTLGRLWLEMQHGSTALATRCRFLTQGVTEPFPAREKKDPRDIRVLDPASGSGHFLLYSFDLLETIYEEAWSDSTSPPYSETAHTLREDYADLAAMKRALPGLVLAHNLYGVDIDLRATQIAALALWLRAQRAFREQSITRIADRPRIKRSNLICAEAMPGDSELRAEFTRELQPRLLGELVEVVFREMRRAGELGSLLKIETSIRVAVAEAKRQAFDAPGPEQFSLFGSKDGGKRQLAFDVKSVDDESFWQHAEGRVIEALRAYASRVR